MFTSSITINYIGFIVDTQLLSYVIYLNENQNLAKITFDQDLNYFKEVIGFNSYDDITDYGNLGGISTNNTLYLIFFNTYKDVFEDLSVQTYIYLTDNNYGESECENLINQSTVIPLSFSPKKRTFWTFLIEGKMTAAKKILWKLFW